MADKQEAQQQETSAPDIDSAELQAAMAALEAEEAAAAEPKVEPQAVAEAEPEPEPAKPEEAPPAEQASQQERLRGPDGKFVKVEGIMIPKGRLDEELARRAEAETQAAFWKTKAETLEQLIADPKATPGEIRKAEAAVVDAADARRQALDEQILAAAQRYDEQEISLREFKKIESDAQKELSKIDRDTLLQEIAKANDPAKGMDLFSEQLIDMLEERHPYSKIITQDHQWDLLAKEAVRQLEGEGVTLGQDPRSQMVVRTRIARLTDVYGPIWHPEAKVATAKPESQPSARQAGPSPQALDRDKKLTLASKFPPNTRDIGSAGTAPDMPSEQAILAMTDDEISALPKATRARLLNQP